MTSRASVRSSDNTRGSWISAALYAVREQFVSHLSLYLSPSLSLPEYKKIASWQQEFIPGLGVDVERVKSDHDSKQNQSAECQD